MCPKWTVFHCNINSCVFILSGSFAVLVEGAATILNHIDGSRNPVEVTGKIYVICNSGIRNQTSTIVSVGSVKYYHVIRKSKNQEGISGIESRNQAKILYDSK